MTTKVVGIELIASDGNSYRWRGAAWARITKSGKTGITAPKKIQYELDRVISGEKILPGKKSTKGAVKWFTDTLDADMKKPKETKEPRLGAMMTFVYDAKHWDTLPYWDKHPLSIIISVESQSMLGLNLHYLPPMIRMKFFEGLLKFTGKNNIEDITDNDVFNVNWQAVSKMPYINKTIHRYLYSHIKSHLVIINPTEWENTIMLPTSKFVGASQREVWKA